MIARMIERNKQQAMNDEYNNHHNIGLIVQAIVSQSKQSKEIV
jgi:hypothetical protein